jgi:hypothetical protein
MLKDILKKMWSFVAFEIERKTDIIALAAFFISVGGFLIQIPGFVMGPEIILIQTTQLMIRIYDFKSGGRYEFCGQLENRNSDKCSITFVTDMSYVNTGRPGQNGFILEEMLSFQLKFKNVVENLYFRGHQFGISIPVPNGLNFSVKGPAKPFVVNAGSAEAHETFFAPDTETSYIIAGDFIRAMEDMLSQSRAQKSTLSIKVSAQTMADGPKHRQCTIEITEEAIKHLKQTGWAAFTCIEFESTLRTL